MAMSSSGETTSTVRSEVNSLEISPSKSAASSKVYGTRKMPSGGKSNGGAADCESGFQHGDGVIPKRR